MRRLLGIHIGRTVGTRGGRQTVGILRRPLDMWMNGSHTGRRRILSGRRRSVWVVCGGRRIGSRGVLQDKELSQQWHSHIYTSRDIALTGYCDTGG